MWHIICPIRQFLELEKAFLKFDTDGNGYITKSELKKAMKELGEKLSKEELADMMNEGNCLILLRVILTTSTTLFCWFKYDFITV